MESKDRGPAHRATPALQSFHVGSTVEGRDDALTATPTRSGWPLLRAVLGRQRGGLIVGVIAGLLWSAGKVAIPALTRLAIDHGIIGHESLWFWSALIAATAVIIGTFSAWRRWVAFHESRLTETRLRDDLFAHFQRLHVGFHDHTQTGQLMSRASSDLTQIQGFVVMIPLTISNLAMVIAVGRPAGQLAAAAGADRARPAAAGQRARPAVLPAHPSRRAGGAGRAGRSWRPWSRRRSAACAW